jgi:antitoxin component of RelBE/YafQ-DinJ toxin-antitoxin module
MTEEATIEFFLSEQEQIEIEAVLKPLDLTIQEVVERFFQYVVRTERLPRTLADLTE